MEPLPARAASRGSVPKILSTAAAAFLGIALAAGPTAWNAARADDTPIAPTPPGWTQPANIAAAEKAASDYHASGRYLHDLALVDQEAGDWIASQAGHVSRPALVLDIDETALSNWEEEQANGFGFFPGGACDSLPRGPCGFTAWTKLARAPALAPTLALFRRARGLGAAVFFITGRNQDVASATADNLSRAGYSGWSGLVLEPAGSHFNSAADFKAPARAAIERQGYTIVATVGDQRSDLQGGHAMRGFLLPNPFYFIP